MTRRAAAAILVASAVVLLFVVAALLGRDGGDPRADLVETAETAEVAATSGASEAGAVAGSRTDTTLAPMRMVPLPTTVDPGERPAGSSPGSGIEPGRLRIPALGVDAPVVAVGLEPDGSMELPGAAEVGWYEPTRVRPGDSSGSAVLAAHVDYQGERGVFFDLRSLPEGAEVAVTGPDGSERRFRVTERFQVDKDDLPVEELFRTTGDPTLTLVTCGGAFDRSVRHYEDNIVVRAVPI